MQIEDIMAKERQAAEEALFKGDVDSLGEVFANDAMFHIYPSTEYKGFDTFKQGIRDGLRAWQWVGIDWKEVICEGNTAVQRYAFHMKHIGTTRMFSVPPTGKEVVVEGCAVYHVNNGKIVEFFEYTDYLGLYQQLGVIPPAGQNE
jgi:predicted ester cyclase